MAGGRGGEVMDFVGEDIEGGRTGSSTVGRRMEKKPAVVKEHRCPAVASQGNYK